MKVDELRVGNFTYKTIDETEVARILPYDFPLCDVKPENYTPIPLTEEWLVNLGWEKKGEWFYKDYYEMNLYGIFNPTDAHYTMHNNIKYVHQLQNLYFVLTGEELVCV